MQLPQFHYLAPSTTDDLILLLAEHGDKSKILSGGTDLLILMQDKVVAPDYLIDINGLKPLHGITYEEGRGLVIGAATKIEVIERSSLVKERYYALYQAAETIGSSQVRAMASIGGNCCNASPAADTPPPLIAFGAKVTLASQRGRREMPLEEFICGNRITAIEPDEFLENFIVPPPWPHSASRHLHLGLREAMEVDMVSVAVNLALDPSEGKISKLRIVMGSVAPTPVRARSAEEILIGRRPEEILIEKAADACVEEAKPIDDVRCSATYRRAMVKVLAREAIQEVLSRVPLEFNE